MCKTIPGASISMFIIIIMPRVGSLDEPNVTYATTPAVLYVAEDYANSDGV
jgi:hypothetical protein